MAGRAHSQIFEQFGITEIDSEDITSAASPGTAASLTKMVTGIITAGTAGVELVTLADSGERSSIKIFLLKYKGNAGDSVEVTPSDLSGGTKITMDTVGQGCILVRHYGKWVCAAVNGAVLG